MKTQFRCSLFFLLLTVSLSILLAGCGHQHTYGEWITEKEPTCTVSGTNVRTCECGETQTETVPATGHKDGQWVVDTEATCTQNGSRHFTCAVCSETVKTEAIPATGHKDGQWVVDTEATCTQNGSRHFTCAVCSETAKTEAIPATGHKDGQWVIDQNATCTASGSKHQVCSVCNTTLKTESIPATGKHDYSEKSSTAASCAGDGAKTFTCSGCGDSYTETIPSKTYSATEIYENLINSVGEIISYNKSGDEISLGTGFVYSSDGKIITNFHVIENAYSAKISIGGNSYQIEQVLSYDKNIDLAILKVSANNLIPVKLCELNHKVGEIVYAFGSSKGLTATFSDGIITYSNRKINNISYTQHDAPISSGNSGGPLINKYGEVIGINTWTVTESQNLNFAINVSELNKLSNNTPMTMAEFYQKECDVFTRLKNYIIENGSYSSSDKSYSMMTGEYYSPNGSTKYTRMAYYYTSNNTITLDNLINNGETWVYFQIDDTLDGSYAWEYFDSNKFEMRGTIYAATYNDNTLLGYSYHNLPTATLRDTVRNLSSTLVDSTCLMMQTDFAAIGITAKDLGFIIF